MVNDPSIDLHGKNRRPCKIDLQAILPVNDYFSKALDNRTNHLACRSSCYDNEVDQSVARRFKRLYVRRNHVCSIRSIAFQSSISRQLQNCHAIRMVYTMEPPFGCYTFYEPLSRSSTPCWHRARSNAYRRQKKLTVVSYCESVRSFLETCVLANVTA